MSYIIASTLEQAINNLKTSDGRAQVIAGATDLFLEEFPLELVDISSVPEILGISRSKGFLSIGAGVTHAETAASSVICSEAEALSEASLQVGSPQVRNMGTLGGNVISAAPAADAAVALVALVAKASLIDLDGSSREVFIEDLYTDYNRSSVDSKFEILLRFLIKPAQKGEGSAFLRFAPRAALALPLVNAAARVRLANDIIQEVRVVVAPSKPAPTRLLETEKLLHGAKPDLLTWQKIEYTASSEVEVRGSMLRCSEEYRRHLVGVLARRVLQRALVRARKVT